MYSPNSRVRFWEQEGQRCKAWQLKGRKYSARQLLQAGAAQSARVIDLVASGELGEVGAEQPLQRVGAPLPVGAWGCGLRLESQCVGHSKD